jgi:hypothetical protein
MLSWFNRNVSAPPSVQKPTELGHNIGPDPPVLLPVASSHTNAPTTVEAGAAPSSEQPQKRVFTAALNTPHDAVLAELQGHHPGHDPSAPIDPTPSASVLGMQSLDTLPAAASDAPDSAISSSSPPPESLYDPFTGALIGVLTRTSSAKRSGEELWAHLARIRALQAEVAGLHVTMEGIGLGEPAVPRLRSTAPRAVGERLADDEDSDADGGSEVEERRALEFERAERRFDGRREEIEQIMTKVCFSIRMSSLPMRRALCIDTARVCLRVNDHSWTSSRKLSRHFTPSIPPGLTLRPLRAPRPCRPPLHSHVPPPCDILPCVEYLRTHLFAVARKSLTAPRVCRRRFRTSKNPKATLSASILRRRSHDANRGMNRCVV